MQAVMVRHAHAHKVLPILAYTNTHMHKHSNTDGASSKHLVSVSPDFFCELLSGDN